MDKNFYKTFAQNFVPFNIDEYKWICAKCDNGEVILHIYTSTKRENEQTWMFTFGANYCVLDNELIKFNLDSYWLKFKNARKNLKNIK